MTRRREVVPEGGLDIYKAERTDLYVAQVEVVVASHVTTDFQTEAPAIEGITIYSTEEGLEFRNHKEWYEFVQAVNRLDLKYKSIPWKEAGPAESAAAVIAESAI